MLIGDLLVNPVRPDNLDEQVHAMTGCSVDEMKVLLRGGQVGFLAAGLLPFIASSSNLSRSELASAIAKAGAQNVRQEILDLYEGQENNVRKPSGSGKRRRRRK